LADQLLRYWRDQLGLVQINKTETLKMKEMLIKLYIKAQILREDQGQDLIEYALVVALIALAATAGMRTVATDINTAFTSIGTKLTTYTS
jgi:pilus assembly protein Flp/PilA